jgi:hypothetical protein
MPMPDVFVFYQSIPLVSYYKKDAMTEENNLFSDYDLPQAKKESEED